MLKLLPLLLCLPFLGYGQDTLKTADTVFTFQTSADLVRTDNIGYLYLVDKDLLIKLGPNGDTMFVASNKQFGEITDIDGSFALKPLLFHQDQNMVTLLDNTLSLQGEPIALDEFDVYQPQVVCNSFAGNTIWIYNLDNFELLKINTENGIEFRSGNLPQQTGIDVYPNDMVEFGNKLYLNNPEYGIMVFDIFGTYIKLIPIKGAEYIQVYENGITYKKGDSFFLYSTLNLTTEQIKLQSADTWMELSGSHLYAKTGKKLTVIRRI